MRYNFDKLANRKNTNSLKWDLFDDKALPMWVADMDFETAPCIKKAVMEKAKIGAYGYSIVPDEYFESISNWYKKYHHFKLEPEWMIFCTGVVAAISSMVRKLTTVGENVLVQSPVYNIFYNSIYNNGRNILSSDLVYENNEYHIDFEDLEEKMSNPQTTLMILCNPHNPIGKIWSKEELAKIGELANKHHVIVISDEIHCELVDPGYEYVPFASVNEINANLCITCIACSKTFNIAGLQSSTVIVKDQNLRHKVWRGINTDEVGEPNFFAVEANIAAYKHGHSYVKQLNEYIYENKQYAIAFIDNNINNAKAIVGHATYLLWVDLSSYSKDSVALCEYIKNKTGLVLNDGHEYGSNGDGFVRINLATSKANVIDGLNRLKTALESYKG